FRFQVSGFGFRVSVSAAELKMHGITGRTRPVAAPGETGVAEDRNDSGMHPAGRPLGVVFRIQVDCNSPRVRRQLCASSLGAKREAAAKAAYVTLQARLCNRLKAGAENRHYEPVASHARHPTRVVPGESEGKR